MANLRNKSVNFSTCSDNSSLKALNTATGPFIVRPELSLPESPGIATVVVSTIIVGIGNYLAE
jgi:hypothetical protein